MTKGLITVRRFLAFFLENMVIALMSGLAILVVVAVGFRKAGAALVWYDEVAAIMLAWLTYYGAALAALHSAHIGFPRGPKLLPIRWQSTVRTVRTGIVVAFFMLTAWAGWRVLQVIGGSFLVSLPWVPRTVAQSVIPIGAVLFVIAELLSKVGSEPRATEDDA